jgi:hypothetical protein
MRQVEAGGRRNGGRAVAAEERGQNRFQVIRPPHINDSKAPPDEAPGPRNGGVALEPEAQGAAAGEGQLLPRALAFGGIAVLASVFRFEK